MISRLGNGRWRPEQARLSDILPTEVIGYMVPIMNQIQVGELQPMEAHGKIYGLLEPHRKALEDLQLSLWHLALKLAYFARDRNGGKLDDISLKDL